jgi:hypothetical protein
MQWSVTPLSRMGIVEHTKIDANGTVVDLVRHDVSPSSKGYEMWQSRKRNVIFCDDFQLPLYFLVPPPLHGFPTHHAKNCGVLVPNRYSGHHRSINLRVSNFEARATIADERREYLCYSSVHLICAGMIYVDMTPFEAPLQSISFTST